MGLIRICREKNKLCGLIWTKKGAFGSFGPTGPFRVRLRCDPSSGWARSVCFRLIGSLLIIWFRPILVLFGFGSLWRVWIVTYFGLEGFGPIWVRWCLRLILCGFGLGPSVSAYFRSWRNLFRDYLEYMVSDVLASTSFGILSFGYILVYYDIRPILRHILRRKLIYDLFWSGDSFGFIYLNS